MANAHDLLMAQRAAMMGGKSLPYLRRVAYLESTGTQWIDTGVIPTIGMSFDFELARLIDGNTMPWGVRYAGSYSDNKQCYINCNPLVTSSRIFLYCENTALGYGWNDDSILNKMTIYSNANVSNLFDNRCDRSITLFAFRIIDTVNASVGISQQRRWAAKINGVYVRDLISVLDLSGRPCMYNQAQSSAPADDPSRFFYNQGTGDDFKWGEL